MQKLIYDRESEEICPHAPDVIERELAEAGFSKGWAMHCKPVPKYFFDSHVHYSAEKEGVASRLGPFAETVEALGVRRLLIIFQIYGEKWNYALKSENIMDGFPYFTIGELKKQIGALFSGNEKLFWSAYLNYQSPEKELIKAAADLGARCVKLHNAPQIEENAPFDLWLSDEWRGVFDAISKRGLPILWHVTQRLPSNVYTGGGRNVYWEKGWRNGVTYGNEDLLQVFLTCCRRYPGINFIGAHQLHIGWERLDELFTEHNNLYVDTTIGCMLRPYDDFYPRDKEYLRKIFIKWADRIIFGTDSFGAYNEQNYLQHLRFITKLDLPQDALDKICFGNLERLCKIPRLI